LAFSNGDAGLFKVGLVGESQLPAAWQDASYIDSAIVEDEKKAVERIRHHQLDLLIDNQSGDTSPRYRYNPSSSKAEALQALLKPESDWQAEAISGREIRYIDWVVPGVLAMNLMFSGLYGVGYVIVRYRKNGVLKRLQATPVSPLMFLCAQLLSRLMIMLVTSALVFAGTHYFLDFLMLGRYVDLFAVALLGNVCLLSMGLLVASRLANEEFANGLLNLLTFPMLLLSELWFSLDGAPDWMIATSQLLPLTHMVQAARAIMLEGASLGDISHHFVAMALLSALFLLISARLFKWRSD
jgi:ABC-type multidrug transport system permease subunit